ncbi:MAG: non-canonical purine NTP pyrophosphatase [Euryarchaeota archaeon]|nr:non-canonical purine NTP pyrophosphatase [Euryarchaeota archaeon]
MRLYFYTSNRFKFRVAERLLRGYGVALERVEPRYREVQAERGEQVVEDALLRAELLPAIAEDSGLFVEALRGFPGTITGYVQRTLSAEHLLRLLEGEERREACFRSVVGLREAGGEIRFFTGEMCGVIAEEPRGRSEYWYDTIFIPRGERRTLAEMSFEEVLEISDWKGSFCALGEYLRGRRGE